MLTSANLAINPLLVIGIRSGAGGEIRLPAGIPSNVPPNTVVSVQAMMGNSGCCLTATHVLEITP